MPEQWTRGMDLSGEVKYKNLKFGSEAEEHPYIIQALNAARRLPLPAGWSVKKTLTEEGEEDYFFCHEAMGLSGWDPPQLRECLAGILRRDGFSRAADRLFPPLVQDEDKKGSFCQEDVDSDLQEDVKRHQQREKEEGGDDEPAAPPPASDADTVTPGGSVDWARLRESIGDAGPRDHGGTYYEDYEEQYHDEQPGGHLSHSPYPSSVASTRSRRSQKWQDIRQHQSQSAQAARKRTPGAGSAPSSSGASMSASRRAPAAVTQQSVRSLAAAVLEDNERVHVLLMELREALARRRGVSVRFLFSNLGVEGSSGSGVYPQESVEALLGLGGGLASLVAEQPALVVRAIAALEQTPGEAELLVYTVLHRVLHPFSCDNSRTTALLLEALNFQIHRAPWDPLDAPPPPPSSSSCSQSAASSQLSHHPSSRVQRGRVKEPACTEQHVLLCMLLLGVTSAAHVPHFWRPLYRPFLRDYDAPPSSSSAEEPWQRAPEHGETLLAALLKSYCMRRDVSLFFRMVWRNVLPALAGACCPARCLLLACLSICSVWLLIMSCRVVMVRYSLFCCL